MTRDQFKDITAGIQSLVVAAGVIVGGGWALYTFRSLGAIQRAEAEQTELEQRIRQVPILQITLQAKSDYGSRITQTSKRAIAISVEVRNSGKRDLSLTTPYVLIAEASVTANGIATASQPYKVEHLLLSDKGELRVVDERILRAGQSRRLLFATKVPNPGFYLIQFKATYAGTDADEELPRKLDGSEIDAFEQLLIRIE